MIPSSSPNSSGECRWSRSASCGWASSEARDPEAAARRLSTYQLAQRFEPLAVDEAVSEVWALLISRLRAEGRRAPINDSWIAATAISHGVPIVTQDADYDAMPGIEVIKI